MSRQEMIEQTRAMIAATERRIADSDRRIAAVNALVAPDRRVSERRKEESK